MEVRLQYLLLKQCNGIMGLAAKICKYNIILKLVVKQMLPLQNTVIIFYLSIDGLQTPFSIDI